ncbi:response regulator [Devosia rhizoryzae]|uniref:Response regulator transcription factor n=1 Tax=Devosia rhizoryzae TaxID=2774137 RepID=A0ABX7C824_9HYPH|nr:response regulator transcription factor [Devosia rhizoryzae]QQR40402.1 response regulator transcription factor [Devosia rhizoryzae]
MSTSLRSRTVTISDDHPIFLQGVEEVLRRHPDFSVIGQATSAPATIELVAERRPDVAILDLSMPGDVFQAIADIAASGTTRTMVYTAYCSVDSAVRALDAGATGFVLKSDPVEELLYAVRGSARGELVISKRFSAEVLKAMRARLKSAPEDHFATLSARETQIVGQLILGQTNKEIAKTLGLTEQTVKHYMTGLMQKLDARNRVDIVIAAKRLQAAKADWGRQMAM